MQNAAREGHGSFNSSPRPQRQQAFGPESENRSEMVATVATKAGIAASTFEVAIPPGIVLGIAAIGVHLPRIGAALNPLFRNTIRGTFKIGHKTRETMAEAHEQIHDMIAEVNAEKRDLNFKTSKSAVSANRGTS